MAQFKCYVIETRTYAVWYTVEAESVGVAEAKAETGETIEEVEEGGGGSVIDRQILGSPMLITEYKES